MFDGLPKSNGFEKSAAENYWGNAIGPRPGGRRCGVTRVAGGRVVEPAGQTRSLGACAVRRADPSLRSGAAGRRRRRNGGRVTVFDRGEFGGLPGDVFGEEALRDPDRRPAPLAEPAEAAEVLRGPQFAREVAAGKLDMGAEVRVRGDSVG